MDVLTAIHATNIPPAQLSALLAEYLALEELRCVRREFLPQLGVLALIFVALGAIGLLTAFEWLATVALLLGAAAWLLSFVRLRDRRFRQHLSQLPGCAMRTLKVRKS
jgi:hypothetical protein